MLHIAATHIVDAAEGTEERVIVIIHAVESNVVCVCSTQGSR